MADTAGSIVAPGAPPLCWQRVVPDGLLAAAHALDRELTAAGTLTAHAVWNELMLAGWVSGHAGRDRARRFRRARRRRYVPHTAWDALTFAALDAALPTLEALAREAVVRLRPWSAPGAIRSADVATAFWRTAPLAFDRRGVRVGVRLRQPLAELGRTLSLLAVEHGFERTDIAVEPHMWRNDPRRREPWLRVRLANCAFADLPAATARWQRWWLAACDAGCTAAAAGTVHGVATGALLATVPDPLEPLRELLAQGVVPSEVGPDGLELYAPVLPHELAPALAARWSRRAR